MDFFRLIAYRRLFLIRKLTCPFLQIRKLTVPEKASWQQIRTFDRCTSSVWDSFSVTWYQIWCVDWPTLEQCPLISYYGVFLLGYLWQTSYKMGLFFFLRLKITLHQTIKFALRHARHNLHESSHHHGNLPELSTMFNTRCACFFINRNVWEIKIHVKMYSGGLW